MLPQTLVVATAATTRGSPVPRGWPVLHPATTREHSTALTADRSRPRGPRRWRRPTCLSQPILEVIVNTSSVAIVRAHRTAGSLSAHRTRDGSPAVDTMGP